TALSGAAASAPCAATDTSSSPKSTGMRSGFLLRRLSVRARTTITATGIVALATAGIGLLLIGYVHTRLSNELDSALQRELVEAKQAVRRGVDVPPARESIRIHVLPPQ